MGTFPDITPGSDYVRAIVFPGASRQDMGHGRGVAYQKSLEPRRVFSLGWTVMSRADADLVDAHVANSFGPRFWFHWFDWKPFWWRWVKIGVGDGARKVWDVPGKLTANHAFYVDGVTPIYGNVNPGAGADGVDVVSLFAPPAAGKLITVAFYGRRRFAVRYRKDAGQPRTRRADTARPMFQFQTEFITWKQDGVF